MVFQWRLWRRRARFRRALAAGKHLAGRLLRAKLPSSRYFPPANIDIGTYGLCARRLPDKWGWCPTSDPRNVQVSVQLVRRAAGELIRPRGCTLNVGGAKLLLASTIAHELCHGYARAHLIGSGLSADQAHKRACEDSAQAAQGKIAAKECGVLWQHEQCPRPLVYSL